ncbi:MAG: hypothetical protein HUJ60_04765 [Bacilli bacterium]|nr:hypothetical protein [Bacilli bacterium]
MEIIRFGVIGVYGTILDYVCEVWITSFFADWVNANAGNRIAAFFIAFFISFLGMLIATPATWSLTSVWGFKNVREEDEKEAKSFKGNLKFLFWATLGLIGGAIIQFLGYMFCLEWSGLGINILKINFSTLFKSDVATFWCFTIVFVIKTAFTMVWNFITRKLFIYRAPKEEPKQE